jgi:hypothetical protein
MSRIIFEPNHLRPRIRPELEELFVITARLGAADGHPCRIAQNDAWNVASRASLVLPEAVSK